MADVDKEITVKVRAEDDTQKATQSAKARLRDQIGRASCRERV